MDAKAITVALSGHWRGRYGLCRCPSHNDRTPSLKIRDNPRRLDGVDVCCFAGCGWEDVKAALVGLRLLDSFKPGVPAPRPISTPAPAEDDAMRLQRVKHIWRTSVPLVKTLGEKYFAEVRGLDLSRLGDLSHALRYHPDLRAVIAGMSDPLTGAGVGIHRTFLNADGTKLERKMLGHAGAIRISPDEDVTEGLGITEGVEDALAVLISGWAPVWASSSAGAIERFPLLAGIESLTIFADDDPPGLKAAHICADRWTAAGREARIFLLKD